MVTPSDCRVLQMLPRSILENLTGVEVAGNQAARYEVHRWAVPHLPWIVVEDAAPLLWISSRPDLNRLRCTCIYRDASDDQDPCKVLIWSTLWIVVSVHKHHHHGTMVNRHSDTNGQSISSNSNIDTYFQSSYYHQPISFI